MNSLANTVFPLSTIFTGRVFVVPDYQRGYAWERDPHLTDFLEDLNGLTLGKPHYTGTLVLHKQQEEIRDKGRNHFDVLHVVDGQQRLTTIVVLLNVLRERFASIGEMQIADGISANYLSGTSENDQPFYRLTLNDDCRDYFARAILDGQAWSSGPTIQSHQRLADARRFFQQQCELLQKPELVQLLDKVTQDLKFGAYLVESNADVGVIFETMNDRGKKLSELELVKNYLLYLASKLSLDASELTKEVNATWSHIFQRLMSYGLVSPADEDRFLRIQWLMTRDYAARNWQGSKSVKSHFVLKKYRGKHAELLAELLSYVQTLRQAVVPFCDAHAPEHSDAFKSFADPTRSKIKTISTKLRRTYVLAPFLPLLVASRLSKSVSADEYYELVALLEKFAFRVYRWAGRRSNAGQSMLLKLGYQLYKGEVSLADACTQVRHTALAYLSNSAFHNEFVPAADNPFYPWMGLKYLLYEFEEHLARGSHIELTWEQLEATDADKSVEHILPQTPKNGYWTQHFSLDERKRFTHAVGNLSLTVDNSAYGRKPFVDKRGDRKTQHACYAQGKLFMERELARFDDWTPVEVESRTRSIRDWAVKRWHLDDTDLPVSIAVPRDEDEAEPLL